MHLLVGLQEQVWQTLVHTKVIIGIPRESGQVLSVGWWLYLHDLKKGNLLMA